MKSDGYNTCLGEELKRIIRNTTDLMFIKDRNFVYVAASDSFAVNCLGLSSAKEVIGKTDFELFKDKSVAQRYRNNDEELFSSKKRIIEFEEVYPDQNEVKHLCLTTKYILLDKEGIPQGLFGHYHDIGDQIESQVSRRNDINKNMANALGRVFFAINYVNLKTHTYEILRSTEYSKKMLEHCDTVEKAFDSFIKTLVQPEFCKKMHEFCNADTLAERLKEQKQITCEYLSKVAAGWCRASFFPAEWDKDGNVTYALFTVASIDENTANEKQEGFDSKKTLQAIFDNVPGGVIMYDWDGKDLKIERISKYYKEEYGYSMLNQSGKPDFLRIHPDDLADYQKAIANALTKTHSLEYVFRMWKNDLNKYGWTQINAVAKPQGDGHSYVYAMYTDVTAQKEAEQEVKEKQELAEKLYRKQIRNLLYRNDDALCMCSVNITQNTFSNVHAEHILKDASERAATLDELMRLASENVIDERQREKYRSMFNRDAILALFEKGESRISLEHFYKISESHTEYVETVLDLMENPITGEIEGICYAKTLNEMYLSKMLLGAAMKRDYLMAALVYVDTGEYYFYDSIHGNFCAHKHNYWEGVGKRLTEVVSPEDLNEVYNNITKEKVISNLEDDHRHAFSYYAFYKGKRSRFETKYQYVNKDLRLALATLRDITDESLYEKYKHESEHDPITGLLNRVTIFKECRNLLNSHPDEKFAMVHCDIRNFHLYNAFFGEDEGNRLLSAIADMFNAMSKDYDYWAYGRIEADVFCAFFPIERGLLEKHVKYYFDKITKFRDNFPLEPIIGLYMVEDSTIPTEAMFTRASIAAKTGCKNLLGIISVYDESMEQQLCNTQQIISEMHSAIAKEEFEVYLQPKYSLRSEKLVGAEALVRWNHSERGMISPGKFIPVFEKNGFIADLDRYMWEHLCRILQRWSKEGRKMFPVSANMSRISMYNRETVPYLKNLVRKYGIDPKYMELELTESAYMDDPEDLKRMLKELQEYGFKILMDDFGSGYSSLNTLRELPVDILKLDMKFLSESQKGQPGNRCPFLRCPHEQTAESADCGGGR